MEIKGEAVSWDSIKDREMQVSLNLKLAVDILKSLDVDILESDGIYWVTINKKDK